MDHEFVLNNVTIKDVLDDLRKPNGDRPTGNGIEGKKLITFDDAVINIWQKLKMTGAPNPRLIEYLLINLIEDTYKCDIQKKNKKKVRIRDATLLSFGLLRDYPHTNISEGEKSNIWLEDRYEEYLDNSDFVEIQYPNQGTYQEIKKCWVQSGGERQDPPLNLLTHSAGDGKKEIAPKLLEIILNKTYNQYLDEDGNVPAFELPNQYFTLDNFPPPTTGQSKDSNPRQSPMDDVLIREHKESGRPEGQEKEADESDENNQERDIDPKPPQPVPNPPSYIAKDHTVRLLLTIISAVLTIVVLIWIGMGLGEVLVSQKAISSAKEQSKTVEDLYGIYFDNDYELLPFGGKLRLTVKPLPDNATLKGLRCKSEGDNAYIIKILSESNPHIESVGDFEGSECKVDLKAYMDYNETISDVVTIHVIKDGENESTGEGELDDKTSGDFSQRAD